MKKEALIVIIYSVYVTVLTSHQSDKWKLRVKLMFTIREVFIIVFIYRITESVISFFVMILTTAFKMSAFPTNSGTGTRNLSYYSDWFSSVMQMAVGICMVLCRIHGLETSYLDEQENPETSKRKVQDNTSEIVMAIAFLIHD